GVARRAGRGGVEKILRGARAERARGVAPPADVNALDLVGAGDLDWIHLEIYAAETLTRVLQPENGPDAASPSLARIVAFTETKTNWHTKGLI
ncbi:MAG: aldehyde dehydrogenase, partial [Cryobacterium sp.]|nr:aldehyde dehydrogenase [Cryobacterium sp.]